MKEGIIMVKLPKEIKSIKGSRVFEGEEIVKYGYVINEDKDGELYMPIELPYYYGVYLRPPASFDIIDDSREFVNGFKVVQTANLEYAYVREADNKLLPYRYDIATDFNEYGYAIVGKDARVSWIDRNFRYFNPKEKKFIEEYEIGSYYRFNGFLGVNDFSNGEYPLSKVYCLGYNNAVSYLGIDGKIKEFVNYDGEIIRNDQSNKNFSYDSEDFNDLGYAKANNEELILLSNGYYLSAKDLIGICEEKEFLDTINSRIEKQELAYTKFLRDVEEKTTTISDNLSKINNLITEYGIGGLELKKEELMSRYGDAVYKRALTNPSFVCLIYNQELPAEIVDLELFQSALAKRGIPSYIDNEDNVFYYNANKHVKQKK